MLTWLAFKAGLKKIWSFIRRYGWIVIVAVVLVVALVGFKTVAGRRVIGQLWDVIKRERALHEEYVTEVDRTHEDELAARELAAKRALEAVKAAEEEYRARNEELDASKKKEIERLVKKSNDDPDELSRKLADQFGFVYVPTEQVSIDTKV